MSRPPTRRPPPWSHVRVLPWPIRLLRLLACTSVLLGAATASLAQPAEGAADEYRLKAAFLLNFATFTTWPEGVGDTLEVCVYGGDPFGAHLDQIATARKAGTRALRVARVNSVDALDDCQMVFVARGMIGNLARVLDRIEGRAALTVADSPGALDAGVMLNMDSASGRISFAANLAAARRQGLGLSARLLNLATEVRQ